MPTITQDSPTEKSAPNAQDNLDRDTTNRDGSDPTGEDQGTQEQQERAKPTQPAKKAGLILLGCLLAISVVVVLILWFIHAGTYEDTDDAQINGHLNSVAARIEGTVTGVYVENNHYVNAGQPLVDLDRRDYQVAYDQTNAQFLQARLNATTAHPNLAITRTSDRADITSGAADVASAEAMVSAAQHDVAVFEARLREAEANNVRAQSDLARYKTLVERDEVSQQQYDQYLASARAQQATVEADESAVSSSKQTVLQRTAALRQQQAKLAQTTANGPQQEQIRTNDIKNQEAGVAVAQSGLERNQLNLTYTHIVAPVSGVVMLRSAEIGDRVSVGQRLMQIVQIDDLWVDANFKETQLRKMRPGQKVTVRVDSLKEDFAGTVDAMPAATGDRTSLFPAENATGISSKWFSAFLCASGWTPANEIWRSCGQVCQSSRKSHSIEGKGNSSACQHSCPSCHSVRSREVRAIVQNASDKPQTKCNQHGRYIMPTTRFETTIKALKDYASMKPEAAVKNIEGWQTYLKDHDSPGVKGIVADLEKLKHLLSAEQLDGSKIKQLVVKLGKETIAVGRGNVPNAKHMEELGNLLEKAA